MRVAILSSVPPVVAGYAAIATALGHEVPVVVAPRVTASDPVAYFATQGDLVFAESRRTLAGILRAYDVDVGLCTGFPWLVPQEAIDAPRRGIVNGHPTLLPKGRGPWPWAWAVRNGDSEIGLTYHYMDASFDTGNVLAQLPVPIDPDHETEESLIPKMEEAIRELLPQVLAKVEAGEPGTPQGDGDYQDRFEPEYEQLDLSRTAAEIHRQVRAWSFVPERLRTGPFLDGRKVARTSVSEVEGAPRVECRDGPLWIVDFATS